MRHILVGYSCNNGCVFCPLGALRVEADLPSPRNAIEDIVSGDVVAFIGGEPTLHPALPAFVALARERGAREVLVQTNGRRLAYPDYARALASAGVSAVDVSLHGSTSAMHEAHTRAPGSFAQTVTGLGVAATAGLRVGVSVVVTRSNVRHLADILRVAHARGVRRASLRSLVLAGAAHEARGRLLFPREIAAPHIAEAQRVAKHLGIALEDEGSAPPLFAGLPSIARAVLTADARDADREEHRAAS